MLWWGAKVGGQQMASGSHRGTEQLSPSLTNTTRCRSVGKASLAL